MGNAIRLRRGKKSTFSSTGAKGNTVLEAGEIFLEYPDLGIGTGACNIKIGDGSSAYTDLPYTVNNDIIDCGDEG